MSIQDLPDELLYQMCEGWDTLLLLNMAESYSRIYQVCSKIINQRKKEYEEDPIRNKIKDFEDKIMGRSLGPFTVSKSVPNGLIYLNVQNDELRQIEYYHNIDAKIKNQIMWPLPELSYKIQRDSNYERVLYAPFYYDRVLIKKLAEFMVKQGYDELK